jgi:hypothetical protein
MLTVYCMGKLWAATVYCIWNMWHCMLVHYVCMWTIWKWWEECLRHVTVQHRSNWQITAVHMIFCLTITLFQNNMTCSSEFKFSKLGVGNSCVREKGEGVYHSAHECSVEQWSCYGGRRKPWRQVVSNWQLYKETHIMTMEIRTTK